MNLCRLLQVIYEASFLYVSSAVRSVVWIRSMDTEASWRETSAGVSHEGTASHSTSQLIRFCCQWFSQGADNTCWPSTGHSWSQTCHFGPHYPLRWRNIGSFCLTCSSLKASTRCRPWKTWLQQVVADQDCDIDVIWLQAHDHSTWRSLQPSLVRRSSERVSELGVITPWVGTNSSVVHACSCE